MKSYAEVLERYDRLWEQAEDFVEGYFGKYREKLERKEEKESPDSDGPTEFKDLNTAITALKRIQDARRAIHLDRMKWDVGKSPGKEGNDLDQAEVARILKLLEGGAPEEDEEEEEAI